MKTQKEVIEELNIIDDKMDNLDRLENYLVSTRFFIEAMPDEEFYKYEELQDIYDFVCNCIDMSLNEYTRLIKEQANRIEWLKCYERMRTIESKLY